MPTSPANQPIRLQSTCAEPDSHALRQVLAYLAAMEARDLARAAGFLGPGFTMIFPGGACFTRPEELAAWGAQRYRNLRKTVTGIDLAPEPDGGAVVILRGTLAGDWPEGAKVVNGFSGIRFIDRFELDGQGQIRRQEVWNDLDSHRPRKEF